MYILGASAYFPLKGYSQTNLQNAVKFGFTFCPVFVETNCCRALRIFTANCRRDSSQKSPHGDGWSLFPWRQKGSRMHQISVPLSFRSG